MKKENLMTNTWSFLSTMKPFLREKWERSGFSAPTSIQLQSTSLILEGRDVVAESPTGTGKTLAYLLPLLQRIQTEEKNAQVVILAPTRELVRQIFEQAQKWAEGSGILSASLIGGADIKRQQEKLKLHPQIVVGTPGRVLELIKLKKLKMHAVKTIVLDEADQLTTPEHRETIQNIIKTTLSDRQLLFFSATLPKQTEEVAKAYTRQPEMIRIQREEANSGNVEHIYFLCEHRQKIDILERLVKRGPVKALAFAKDIGNFALVASKLRYKGVDAEVLHSESKKTEREAVLKNFREGKFPLLLASDVAARGLDIEGLTHVVHLDFPQDADQYIHRSGRTGRMGAAGTVISLVTVREERILQKFSQELGIPIHKKVLYAGQITDERPSKKRTFVKSSSADHSKKRDPQKKKR
jgi:superfamily II DNA/RNA helicase